MNITTLIVFGIISIIVPITYLIMFKCYKAKHKNYKRAFAIAFCMFLIVFGLGLVVSLIVGKFVNKEEVTTTTTKETTIVKDTTTTTKETTTTEATTKNPSHKLASYDKIEAPSGGEVVGKTPKGFEVKLINNVYYIDGYIMANKTYALPSTYYPKDTYKDASNVSNTCNDCLIKTVNDAYVDMKNDAALLGLNLVNNSGYRSYNTQKTLWNRYAERDGADKADTYSSRPGHSDHQTGFAFDLNSITDAFANTKEGKWINDNCWKYGFVIRFPKGKDKETGYQYESWHLRYVGYDLAKKLYNDGDWISLEEYLGITSNYNDEPIGGKINE